jgi:hypothetical protein
MSSFSEGLWNTVRARGTSLQRWKKQILRRAGDGGTEEGDRRIMSKRD